MQSLGDIWKKCNLNTTLQHLKDPQRYLEIFGFRSPYRTPHVLKKVAGTDAFDEAESQRLDSTLGTDIVLQAFGIWKTVGYPQLFSKSLWPHDIIEAN